MSRVISNSNLCRYLAVPLLLVGWLGTAPAHATDVYHWIDANGVPNYSEHAPEGIDYVKLKLGNSPTKKVSSLPPPFPVDPAPKTATQAKQRSGAKKTMP